MEEANEKPFIILREREREREEETKTNSLNFLFLFHLNKTVVGIVTMLPQLA